MKKLIYAVSCIALAVISCGVQTALPVMPTPAPVINAIVQLPQPTATEVHIDIVSSCDIQPDFDNTIAVKTLGTVNVRECPSTDSPVLAVLPFDTMIDAGAKIETQNTGYNCNRWRPVVWEGKAAWICAGWLSK